MFQLNVDHTAMHIIKATVLLVVFQLVRNDFANDVFIFFILFFIFFIQKCIVFRCDELFSSVMSIL